MARGMCREPRTQDAQICRHICASEDAGSRCMTHARRSGSLSGQAPGASRLATMDPVLELAENANAYTPLGPRDERIFTDRYVLWMGRGDEPPWNVAQRFRLRADDVEAARDEIHGHLRRRGRTSCSWEVGSSATPPDLVERLHALGLVDDDPDPLAIGMVLTDP